MTRIPSRLLLLPLLALLSATALALPGRAGDDATREEVEKALAAGDLERAHELLTSLVVGERLGRVESESAAGHHELAWRVLKGVLHLSPSDARALALRSRIAGTLLEQHLVEARELVAQANPRDAMILLDEASELAPRNSEVLFLRGECSLRMGLEDGEVIAFADSRDAFLRAARSGRLPAAWAGAGRALFQLYGDSLDAADLARALEYARLADTEVRDGDELAALLSFPVRTNYARIAYFSYIAAKRGGVPGGTVKLRFEEARKALEACIGDAPEESWAWLQLAELYQWEERPKEELATVLRALEASPAEPEYLTRFGDVNRRAGGFEQSLPAYYELVEAEPEIAIRHWYLAGEQFELALELMLKGETDVDGDFAAAEESYVRCRELEESYQGACSWKEARCRLALGRAAFLRGELDAASEAFISMEQVVEGGLQESYPGKLHTGIDSLRILIGKYIEHAGDQERPSEERTVAWNSAADLASWVFGYRPEDFAIANDAGFVNRDAAIDIEYAARRVVRPVLEEDAPLDEGMRAEVMALLERAREVMERSYVAYVAASEIAPDDARTVNDTGLILAYYLHRDLDAARARFEHALSTGEERLEAGIEDQAELDALTEAVGDAYQNLGVMALTLDGDAAAARVKFLRSLQLAPQPRPEAEQWYLPICELVLKGELEIELVKTASTWLASNPETLIERLHAKKALRAAIDAAKG